MGFVGAPMVVICVCFRAPSLRSVPSAAFLTGGALLDFRSRGIEGMRSHLLAQPGEILEVTRVFVHDGAAMLAVTHLTGQLVDALPLTDAIASSFALSSPSHSLSCLNVQMGCLVGPTPKCSLCLPLEKTGSPPPGLVCLPNEPQHAGPGPFYDMATWARQLFLWSIGSSPCYGMPHCTILPHFPVLPHRSDCGWGRHPPPACTISPWPTSRAPNGRGRATWSGVLLLCAPVATHVTPCPPSAWPYHQGCCSLGRGGLVPSWALACHCHGCWLSAFL